MSDINKFTTKEVLNKVLLDSSGNAVEAFSHTTQEALNAALDTTNNRLNVSLNGGTISGDVTISGDLTVNGSGTNSYDEIINGDLHVKSDSGNSTSAFLVEKNDGTDVLVVDTSNSRVGIGVTPTETLSIFGGAGSPATSGAGANGNLAIESSNGNSIYIGSYSASPFGAWLQTSNYTDQSLTYPLILNPNGGSVGIGSNSPISNLEIKGTNSALDGVPAGLVVHDSGNSDSGLQLINNSGKFAMYADGANNRVDFYLDDATTGSSFAGGDKILTLKYGGNVGISQDDPQSKLHINVGTDQNLEVTSVSSKLHLMGTNDARNANIPLTLGFSEYVFEQGSATFSQPVDGDAYIALDNVSGGSSSVNETSALRLNLGDGSTIRGGAKITAKKEADYSTGANMDASLTFSVLQNNGYNDALIISSAGNATFGGAITSGGNVTIPAGNLLYLDGGSNTYIYQESADKISFATNSGVRLSLDNNSRISLSNNDGGTLNTAVGYQAGTALASGSTENTVFGHQAGLALSTGDYNTAIGALALKSEDAGNRTVAVGTGALFSQNVADVAGNVAVGFTAGYYNVTGTLNTWVGHEAGQGASGQSNSQNTGIGYRTGWSLTTGSNNTFLGRQCGLVMTDGADNTFVGMNAGAGTVSGTKMVAIGNQSLFSNATTDATGTVAIGYSSLNALTSGGSNTAIGYSSMAINTDSSNNTAVGYLSLTNVNGGNGANTAVGNLAMLSNTTGATNTAVGDNASRLNQTGVDNVAVGRSALYNNTTDRNTAIGLEAGYTTTGADNTYVGYRSGYGASGAEANNVGVGQNSLLAVTTGSDNVAIGSSAGDAVTSQSNLTLVGKNAGGAINDDGADGTVAVGTGCLGSLTSGADNVAIGMNAMFKVNTGHDNVALGKNAGFYATTAGFNTFIGKESAQGINATKLTGDNNVAVGYRAGYNMQGSSASNVIVGSLAGDAITTGTSNVIVGQNSDISAVDGTNQIVIGQGATGTGNNEIALGNTSISAIKAQVTSITAYSSDERTKKDIADYDLKGVDFIKELSLKTYIYKNPADFPDEIRDSKWDEKDEDGNLIHKKPEDSTETQVGLIAQEVEEALKKHGVGNTETYAPTQDNGIKTLTYGNLIFPLIKAVQELSARVEELEKK